MLIKLLRKCWKKPRTAPLVEYKYPIPKQYLQDFTKLRDAFVLDVGPVLHSDPVYYKLLRLKELFAYYRSLFADKEQAPSLVINSHEFSSVSMTIKLRMPDQDQVEFLTATFEFQGNQLNLVMRNLKKLMVKTGVSQ